MPSVVEQRDELTRFGVPIEGFRHPAPETLESWEERLVRLFGTLRSGDVLVVANVHALGRDIDEETRTVAELHRRGVVVKVLEPRRPAPLRRRPLTPPAGIRSAGQEPQTRTGSDDGPTPMSSCRGAGWSTSFARSRPRSFPRGELSCQCERAAPGTSEDD